MYFIMFRFLSHANQKGHVCRVQPGRHMDPPHCLTLERAESLGKARSSSEGGGCSDLQASVLTSSASPDSQASGFGGYRTRYGSTSDCFREEIMMCRGEDKTQSENKQLSDLSLSDEMP